MPHSLLAFLHEIKERQNGLMPWEGYRYQGSIDLALRVGWKMQRSKHQPGGRRPYEPARQTTFERALRFARKHEGRYVYCEGFATNSTNRLPVYHAWCLNLQGYVVDVAWPWEEAEYWGLPLKTSFVVGMVRATKRYGVIDAHIGGYDLCFGTPEIEEVLEMDFEGSILSKSMEIK